MTARLVILYGHPDDEDAFERYYADQHVPYAAEHMPNVRDARNARVVGTAGNDPSPYHRISHLVYDDVRSLREGIESDEGRAVLADLDNFATGGVNLLVVEDD